MTLQSGAADEPRWVLVWSLECGSGKQALLHSLPGELIDAAAGAATGDMATFSGLAFQPGVAMVTVTFPLL